MARLSSPLKGEAVRAALARLSPTRAAGLLPLRRRQCLRRERGGRLERHGLSSPTPSVGCTPTGELSPMAFLVGVRLATDTPILTRQDELAPPGDVCGRGWRKSAELTHGASFLPPQGGGGPCGAGETLSNEGRGELLPLRRRQCLRRERGGRLERHGLSSPTSSVGCTPTGELTPMAFLVGVRLATDTPTLTRQDELAPQWSRQWMSSSCSS